MCRHTLQHGRAANTEVNDFIDIHPVLPGHIFRLQTYIKMIIVHADIPMQCHGECTLQLMRGQATIASDARHLHDTYKIASATLMHSNTLLTTVLNRSTAYSLHAECPQPSGCSIADNVAPLWLVSESSPHNCLADVECDRRLQGGLHVPGNAGQTAMPAIRIIDHDISIHWQHPTDHTSNHSMVPVSHSNCSARLGRVASRWLAMTLRGGLLFIVTALEYSLHRQSIFKRTSRSEDIPTG